LSGAGNIAGSFDTLSWSSSRNFTKLDCQSILFINIKYT